MIVVESVDGVVDVDFDGKKKYFSKAAEKWALFRAKILFDPPITFFLIEEKWKNSRVLLVSSCEFVRSHHTCVYRQNVGDISHSKVAICDCCISLLGCLMSIV